MLEGILSGYGIAISVATALFIAWVIVTYKRSKKNQHDIFIDQSKWGEE